MSAHYYPGTATYTCYNDCCQAGCPGHAIRLKEKHGGLIVMFVDKDGETTQEAHLPFDFHLYHAVTDLLRAE